MFTKLTTPIKGKVAIAVLGALALVGGGGAVAVAASQGQLHALGIQLGSQNHGKSDSTETPAQANGAMAATSRVC
jgi:hypothetical protein